MGKIELVNGDMHNMLEKLKGIKADLVRGEEGWQEWDLPRLVIALKKWRDINPIVNASNNDDKYPPKQPGRRTNFYHAKDSDRKRQPCVYCSDNSHTSKDCTKVTSTAAQKKLLADNKLCFNCTGAKHRSSDCKSTVTCHICDKLVQGRLMTATGSHVPLVYHVVIVNVGGIKCCVLLDTGAGSSYALATP
jgi:hypothetical protein